MRLWLSLYISANLFLFSSKVSHSNSLNKCETLAVILKTKTCRLSLDSFEYGNVFLLEGKYEDFLL